MGRSGSARLPSPTIIFNPSPLIPRTQALLDTQSSQLATPNLMAAT